MKASKTDLLPYLNNRKEAAKKFGVCERTVVRWLISYDLYQARKNYGCRKLDIQKAKKIREKHKEGASLKELAKGYGVTFSSISRVVHGITYKEPPPEEAKVTMVYNPH